VADGRMEHRDAVAHMELANGILSAQFNECLDDAQCMSLREGRLCAARRRLERVSAGLTSRVNCGPSAPSFEPFGPAAVDARDRSRVPDHVSEARDVQPTGVISPYADQSTVPAACR
jgi:hypothetical protein